MFLPEEKSAAFDKIAEKFYRRNFGQMGKAYLEVLMFSIYIEQCLEKGLRYDDYTLAVQLGIPESRVRTLKVKKELQYPYKNFHWEEAFQECIRHAKYDDKKALVKVSITDPNVKREVENCIDQMNFYSEYQLNTKLLQMRPDQFIELCINLYSEDAVNGKLTEQGFKTLESQLRKSKASGLIESERIIEKIRKEGFNACFQDVGSAVAKTLLGEVLKAIPFGGTFSGIIDTFIKNL